VFTALEQRKGVCCLNEVENIQFELNELEDGESQMRLNCEENKRDDDDDNDNDDDNGVTTKV
jgi:hypothetical protein